MTWWRRRRHTGPAVTPWPRPDAVVIVSAEWQEVAFIDVSFIQRMTSPESRTSGRAVLRRTGGEKWLRPDEVSSLRAELAALLDRTISDDERGPQQSAVEMIDDVGDRGILHVPASDAHW